MLFLNKPQNVIKKVQYKKRAYNWFNVQALVLWF